MSDDELIKSLIRDVPDFPKTGIVFKDITPLLLHPLARTEVVRRIARHYEDAGIDAIAAVEARGFLFGALIAHEMGLPLITIRKAGKLPFEKIRETYDLEYGTATIEMHTDALKPGCKVLLHDDLLATGGTAIAAAKMIHQLGGIVTGCSFILNLAFLPGEQLLAQQFPGKVHYILSYS